MTIRWLGIVAAGTISLSMAVACRAAAVEQEVSLDKVPAAVRATIEKHAAGAKIHKVEIVTETVYDVEIRKDGKATEFSVSPDGKYLGVKTDEDGKDKAKQDKKEKKEGKGDKKVKHEPKAKAGDFSGTFDVDKANLTNVGKNPYFIPLVPGYRLVLSGGGGTLTVTVTDKTKLVDGVETRVVEEREEKNGQPIEISQNYFAIDKTTGAVYYFGEDVDIYKDGKVVEHSGAWLSGVDGAKFGLMMPGKPKAGDKFQQEIAPKTAMDRCEIAAIGEQLVTPAGTFKKCLRTKEGSSLEKGTSEKVYAPEIGLVKDDEFLLVKTSKMSGKKKAQEK
jgi:hypothetical protein